MPEGVVRWGDDERPLRKLALTCSVETRRHLVEPEKNYSREPICIGHLLCVRLHGEARSVETTGGTPSHLGGWCEGECFPVLKAGCNGGGI